MPCMPLCILHLILHARVMMHADCTIDTADSYGQLQLHMLAPAVNTVFIHSCMQMASMLYGHLPQVIGVIGAGQMGSGIAQVRSTTEPTNHTHSKSLA